MRLWGESTFPESTFCSEEKWNPNNTAGNLRLAVFYYDCFYLSKETQKDTVLRKDKIAAWFLLTYYLCVSTPMLRMLQTFVEKEKMTVTGFFFPPTVSFAHF